MPIGAIASIGGALIGAGSANKAAKEQTAAAKSDIAFQRETRDLQMERLDPFRQAGMTANDALMFELGLGPRPMVGGTPAEITTVPGAMRTENVYRTMGRNDNRVLTGTRQVRGADAFSVGGREFATREEAEAYAKANPTGGTPYAGFTATPGYDFRVQQGIGAVNALAGARGGVNSGRTLQELTSFGQGIASEEYNNFLNRLTGQQGIGLNAAAGQGQAGQFAAGNISNAYAGIGNAKAAGAIGVGNAINSGINNGLALWQYQQAQNSPAGGAGVSTLRPQPNPFY